MDPYSGAGPSPVPIPREGSNDNNQTSESQTQIPLEELPSQLDPAATLSENFGPSNEYYPDFTIEEAQSNPRKYVGYPIFSRWIASDQSFCIFRRFGTLNSRVLLAMQDEIVQLEDKLNSIDETLSRKAFSEDVDNGTFRADQSTERNIIINTTIPEKLAKYNSYVNEYSQILARPVPNPGDVQSIRAWLAPRLSESFSDLERRPKRYRGPVDDLESGYVHHPDDLIALQPNSRSWFRRTLEQVTLIYLPWGISLFFQRLPSEAEFFNEITGTRTVWHNDRRVNALRSALTGLLGLGMLLSPLWTLEVYSDSSSVVKLGIITTFIVFFFVIVAVATTMKVMDAVAASAAYAAAMTVYLSFQG